MEVIIRRMTMAGGLLACALLAGCAAATPVGMEHAKVVEREVNCVYAAPSEIGLAHAFLDTDGDGLFGPLDSPLQGAVFVIRWSDGTVERSVTGVDGMARYAYDPRMPEEGSPPECAGRDILDSTMEPPAGTRYVLVRQDGLDGFLFGTTGGIKEIVSGTPEITQPPLLTATPAFWPTGMPPPTRGPTAVPVPTARDGAECRERGATWADEWLFGGPNCQRYPTSDGGRPCSDGSECQAGWCDANLTVAEAQAILEHAGDQPVLMTGTCPTQTPTYCTSYARVEDGRLAAPLVCE